MICKPRNTCTPESSSAAAPIQGCTARARGLDPMKRETTAAAVNSSTIRLPTVKCPLAPRSRSSRSQVTLASPTDQLAAV